MVPGQRLDLKALTPCRRVEIGLFAPHPMHEFGNRRVLPDRVGIIANARKFGIGEVGVDRLVTDRVDGHSFAALLRFWHRMVPLDKRFKPAPAKPAG